MDSARSVVARSITVLLSASCALGGVACATRGLPHASSPDAQQAHAAQAVVEARDLPRVIAEATPPLVTLDVRTVAAYDAGHLPGAVRVDHARWESDSLSDAYGLANEALWRSRIGELGIDGRGTVVVYDGGSMTDAARIWFILQSFGTSDVRVVNGGFPLIAQAAKEGTLTLSTEPATPRAAAFLPASAESARIAWIGRQDLKSAVDEGRVQILDARSIKEFEGTDLRGNSRGGHLPGATSVPHTSMLDSQRRLKSPEELASMFRAAGLSKGKPIVTHCQGGGRAALAALAAARAGYGPVVSYYLSFGDWSADASCPVVAP
jgi:thiosulfate/3-mercaptopyruvate sulfurtransferase